MNERRAKIDIEASDGENSTVAIQPGKAITLAVTGK